MTRKPPAVPPVSWPKNRNPVQMKPKLPTGASTFAIQMMRASLPRTSKTNHLYVGKNPQHIDKRGRRFWTGWRNDVRFTDATKLYFVGSKAGGCQIGKVICQGIAVGLDHIIDFATTQSALMTETYCDGRDHWDGVPWDDAMDDYNNLANLRWACTQCNSSDSGARGLYSPPSWVSACPGAGCTL